MFEGRGIVKIFLARGAELVSSWPVSKKCTFGRLFSAFYLVVGEYEEWNTLVVHLVNSAFTSLFLFEPIFIAVFFVTFE